jgi:hypothetical protein
MTDADFQRYAGEVLLSLPLGTENLAILGGGALRALFDRTEVKDYDLFFRTENDYVFAAAAFGISARFEELDSPAGTKQFRETRTGRLFNLIGFHFNSPEGHAAEFDFRCCQMVAWYDSAMEFHRHFEIGAVSDAKARLIVVENNNGEDRTLKRIEKYIAQYGYTVEVDTTDTHEDFPYEGLLLVGEVLTPHVTTDRPAIARRVRRIPVSERRGSDGI